MATSASPGRHRASVAASMEVAVLAVIAYLPFLLSDPGKVSADSKQYLYLDPGAFLGRAMSLWDPQVAAGTVPHQHLGYLVPMGPWFWALDRLGLSDWVAQRLWLGSLTMVAALGARWLFRQLGVGAAGALAGALVYALTPYQLAFTARSSVLLLPWAALPWLVGWTMRATRGGGWRAAAGMALALFLTGGVNASSLLLVAVAPVLWIVLEASRGRDSARRALAATGRISLLAAGVAAWWLVGLRLQASHGLPVLQLTENVPTVAASSSIDDVLRGLGNWFFYGRDRQGWSIDQAQPYAEDRLVIALSYALPCTALVAALVLRWAHRAYFAGLVVVGAVIAVGAWPYADRSPYGDVWERLTSETSVGLAFRNSARIVPVLVLGLAGCLAGAIGAIRPEAWRRAGAGASAVLAVAALLPVAQHGFLTDGMLRPEEVPEHWLDAATSLDAGDHGTRILEVPGSSFAAYAWGTTVEPVTPGLTDRPYLAREVLPAGTAGTANLLDALDRRIQQGWFEPAALAPIARLLGVGTVALRADLAQDGRFDQASTYPLWQDLEGAAGLAEPERFGHLADHPDAPAVALFDVLDPQPIVRTRSATAPVVVAGDGDGLVDLAAAGLLDGSELVLTAAATPDAVLDGALLADSRLVLTDSNRRRIQTWFYSLRDTRGPTERAGEVAPDPTGYDMRLEVAPGLTDDSRTVVEQLGGQVDATGGGGPERPEDRAARAVDGDPTTAWRVAGADPRGQSLTLVPDRAVATDHIRLVQPPSALQGRSLARVRITVAGAAPVEVDLGPDSLTPSGQAVALPVSHVDRLTVEIVETSPPAGAGAVTAPVGLAEVRLGDLVVDETVRLPIDLLERTGDRGDDLALDVVMTRLRLGAALDDRQDDERRLDRTFELPATRTFALTGLVRQHDVRVTDAPQPGACRADLVRVDGAPLAVRMVAGTTAGTLDLAACEPVTLGPGGHRLVAEAGASTGLDVDRLVLRSAAASIRPAPTDAAPAIELTSDGSTALDAVVEAGAEPFWLVLGQSLSAGWDLAVDGADVGPRTMVDGYANGWLVTPAESGPLEVRLRWTPQRLVWSGFVVTAIALLASAIILLRSRRRSAVPDSANPLAVRPQLARWTGDPVALGVAATVRGALLPVAVTALTMALVSDLRMAAITAALTVVAAVAPHGRWVLVAAAPGAVALSQVTDRRSLAWVAVAALVADVLIERQVSRQPPSPSPS